MKNLFSQKNFQESIIIFFIVLIAYGYFSWGLDWNVNSRLGLVKAFVEKGIFEIDAYHDTELATHDKSFINDHYYSDKAIGSSLLGIFVYYPIYWFYSLSGASLSIETFCKILTFLVVSLPVALIAPFSYIAVKQITDNSIKALMVSLGISLGTPLFKYSAAYYGHSLAAAAYFFAILIWFNAKHKKKISLSAAFISALLLGYMIITEYPTALLALLLAPYILSTLYKSKQLLDWKIYIALAIGFSIPVCALLYYNHNVFGSYFSIGYAYEDSQAYREAHLEGLMGISKPDIYVFWYQTLQPAFGIFWQSPILFLVFPGWIFMLIKKYYAEALLCFATIFLYILMFSGYYMWWGGLAFTPRHIIPILPIFIFPLAFVPEILSIPLALTMALSVFQNLVLTASNFDNMIYIKERLIPIWKKHGIIQPRGMLVYDVCLPNVLNGSLMNNRGLDTFGLSGVFSLFPLILLELSLLLLYIKVFFKAKLDRNANRTIK